MIYCFCVICESKLNIFGWPFVDLLLLLLPPLQVLHPLCPPRSPGAEASSPAFSAVCVGTSLNPNQSTTTPLCWSRRTELSPRCVYLCHAGYMLRPVLTAVERSNLCYTGQGKKAFLGLMSLSSSKY